jgi:hypothetical protein
MKNFCLKISTLFPELPNPEAVYLVILHAGSKPPHMGLMIGGLYSSLSVKGKDLDIPAVALMKNIRQRKIVSLFVELKSHPIHTLQTLNSSFKSSIHIFPRVDIGIATCLTPILLFLAGRYSVQTGDIDYLYQLLPRLKEEGWISKTQALFADEQIKGGEFELPYYTKEEIYKGIEQVRTEYKN